LFVLSKCANPDCSNHFLYLREGKLFRMEVSDPSQDTTVRVEVRKAVIRQEYFWLCADCARHMTVVRNKDGRIRVERLTFLKAKAS